MISEKAERDLNLGVWFKFCVCVISLIFQRFLEAFLRGTSIILIQVEAGFVDLRFSLL